GGRQRERRPRRAVERPVERARSADGEQRDCRAGDDLIRAQKHHEPAEDRRDEHAAQYRDDVPARGSKMRRSDERTECTAEDDSLEADVDDAHAFHHDLAECGERQGRRGAHGSLDECARDAHAGDATMRARRMRSNASTARMIAASTTETTTEGTPASRCIADAPASSAPNRMPVAITPSAFNRASRATAIAVKPYPGERFSYNA